MAGSSFQRGDVNGDGVVNIGDVTALISMVLKSNSSADDNPAADLNGDGELNISDVTALISMVLRNPATTTIKAAASQRASSMHGPSAMIPEEKLIMERPKRAAFAD